MPVKSVIDPSLGDTKPSNEPVRSKPLNQTSPVIGRTKNKAGRRPFKTRQQKCETRSSTPDEQPTPITQAKAFSELVRRSNLGNQQCLEALRAILDQQPGIWQAVGDVSKMAERAWIAVVSPGDKLVEESIQRRLIALKAEMGGVDPNPLEKMLIDLVGVSWLAVFEAEISAAQSGGSPQQVSIRLRRAESAQKRFLRAIKTLTTVRALLPPGAN